MCSRVGGEPLSCAAAHCELPLMHSQKTSNLGDMTACNKGDKKIPSCIGRISLKYTGKQSRADWNFKPFRRLPSCSSEHVISTTKYLNRILLAKFVSYGHNWLTLFCFFFNGLNLCRFPELLPSQTLVSRFQWT